jgi:hypothetical protein
MTPRQVEPGDEYFQGVLHADHGQLFFFASAIQVPEESA